ncbi:MAG: hypothetical protein EXR65_05090 [Dehalococcoidia bacterium]|nr:hypothetical protein [Dehalococcoidia bacterium]
MTTTLRLFPLHMVLFPGMPLSLQIFEERYRTLVSECLTSGEPFGVVLSGDRAELGAGTGPFPMGTTALIDGVTPLASGRLALTGHGVRRFHITRLLYDRPYLSAEVDYPVDEATEVPPALLEQVASNYAQLQRLRHTIGGSWVREVRVPQSPAELADAVGAAGNGLLEPRRLQPLLEMLDMRRRLERADDLLASILESTHRRAQQAVAQRWGGPEHEN